MKGKKYKQGLFITFVQESGATDEETMQKIGNLVHEIVEDIKKDWAGRVEDWTGEAPQARMDMLVKELGECWEESKGDKDKMRDCIVRDYVTWVKVYQRADGINCMLDSRGDVDDLLPCKGTQVYDSAHTFTSS